MLNGSVSSVLDKKVIVMYRLGAWLFKFSNKSYFALNFKLRSTKSSACHARTVAESFNISSNNK